MQFNNFQKFLLKNNLRNLIFLGFIFFSFFMLFSYSTSNLFLELKYSISTKQQSENFNINFKNYFYDVYVFDVANNLRSDRIVEGFSGGDGRHKLRWFYRSFESKFYYFIFENIYSKKSLTFFVIVSSMYCFFSFLFCFLTIAHLKKKYSQTDLIFTGLFFVTIISIICSTGIQSVYTLPEMFFISLGLYAVVKNNLFLFLISVFFAVANRESGIALSLIYVFFNHKKIYSYFLPILSVFFLLILNYDLVQNPSIYKLSTYFPIKENYSNDPINKKDIIFFISFLFFFLVTIFSFVKIKPIDLNSIKLFLTFTLYFFVATLGTNLTNLYSLMLTIPSLTVLLIFSYDKLTSNDMKIT